MGVHSGSARGASAKAWLKLLTGATCAVFVCAEVWAASALAYDKDTGVLGYGIAADKDAARAAAIQDCENNGATKPKFWFAFGRAGWGASAYSDNGGGNWAIGGALGYGKKKKAKRKAIEECEAGGGINCQVVDVFEDTIGKKAKKRGGEGYHLSSN